MILSYSRGRILRVYRPGGLCVFAGLMMALLGSSVASAELLYAVSTHGLEYVRDTDAPRDASKGVDAVVTENGTTFFITYDDVGDSSGVGFDHPTEGADRRARMEDALRYIANVLNESGDLDVLIKPSETDGGGFLASAGTLFSSADTTFTNGEAFDVLRSGLNPDNGEEIFVTVNFGFTWYAGEGTPGVGEFDLQSVLTHEITHGMGVIHLSDENGDAALFNNVYSVWESFIERSGGSDLWALNPTLADFVGVVGDLTSDDLVFTGSEAVSAFGSDPPVYAPGFYSGGSIISHFDSGIAGGAVMEPTFSPGEVIREYAPVEIGALVDVGWTNAAAPATGPGVEITGQSGPGFFVEIGSSVEFSVTTSGEVGTPTFMWRKDGVLVANGAGDGYGDVSGATTATLTINNIDMSATGSFVVEVNDDAKAQVFSEPFVIDVVAGLPVTGLLGLGLLAGVCALGGASALRRTR